MSETVLPLEEPMVLATEGLVAGYPSEFNAAGPGDARLKSGRHVEDPVHRCQA